MSYRYDIIVERRGSFMDHGVECWSNATSTRTEDNVDSLAHANEAAMEILTDNDSDDVQRIIMSLNNEIVWEHYNNVPQEWNLPYNPFSV